MQASLSRIPHLLSNRFGTRAPDTKTILENCKRIPVPTSPKGANLPKIWQFNRRGRLFGSVRYHSSFKPFSSHLGAAMGGGVYENNYERSRVSFFFAVEKLTAQEEPENLKLIKQTIRKQFGILIDVMTEVDQEISNMGFE